MVSLSIYSLSKYGKNVLSYTCYIIFAIVNLSLLQSSCHKFYLNFRINCFCHFTDMLGLNRNEKVLCCNCGIRTTNRNIVRQKTKCSIGTLHWTKCPNLSATSQADLNYHMAEKHPRQRANNTYKCKICLEEFSPFYATRENRSSQHGNPIRTSSLDMDTLLEDIHGVGLKEEPNFCNHFLVDSELEKGRHSVINFAMSSLSNSFFNENMDHVFNQLKCAAKVNLAFGFVPKNLDD